MAFRGTEQHDWEDLVTDLNIGLLPIDTWPGAAEAARQWAARHKHSGGWGEELDVGRLQRLLNVRACGVRVAFFAWGEGVGTWCMCCVICCVMCAV